MNYVTILIESNAKMFRFFVVSAIMASVMAFAPSAMRSSRSALRMSAAGELASGATAPFGFFDPLGLSKGKSEADIRKWREAELKHGRVAMVAALGILVGEEVEFGTPLFNDKVVGPAIYQFQEADQVTGFGFAALIVGLIAFLESKGFSKYGNNVTGDYGFDPLGLAKNLDADGLAAVQNKELNNGRLAMIATAGMLVQELVNGKGVLENLGLESALPKAFDTGIL